MKMKKMKMTMMVVVMMKKLNYISDVSRFCPDIAVKEVGGIL